MPKNNPAINHYTQYAVLDRFTREIVYTGRSPANCAEASIPGTVYGYGPTEAAAIKMANDIIDRCNGKGAA